jgi:hypothetical protein
MSQVPELEVGAPARAAGELVAVVVEEFDHYPRLDNAHAGVQEALRALEIGGFRSRAVLRGTVAAEAARDHIGRWQPDGRPLLLYWTGHGLRRENGELFLACSDTPADPGDDTVEVLRARQLGALLARKRLPQTVVFLDACNSGGGVHDVVEGFVEQRQALADASGTTPELSVIASASKGQSAREGVFPDALVKLLCGAQPPADLPQDVRAYLERSEDLSPGQLAGALQAVLVRDRVHWQTIGHEMDGYGIRPVFRNPHFIANLPAFPVGEPGRDAERPRVDQHFVDKFRGIEALSERGWYFSGRTATLAAIRDWLDSPQPGVFALTGPPGCGKSAVLGRLAVLSDERTRAQAAAAGALDDAEPQADVRVGALDAGVHIRDLSSADCVAHLAAALRLGETVDAKRLCATVNKLWRSAKRPPVVMLDALDEAATDEVLVIAKSLVLGLAEQGGAKVIVGVRSAASPRNGAAKNPANGRTSQLDTVIRLFEQAPGSRVWRLDADEAPEDQQRDVEDYIVRRLLETPRSPYAGEAELAREAGHVLAPLCEGMFLAAQVRSRVLAGQAVPTEPARIAEVTARSLDDAFVQDLRRFGADEPWVRTMLRPLAWAQGDGLPPALWHRLAEELRPAREVRPPGRSGPPTVLPPDAVAQALDRAAAYLIEDGEDGQLVYRLYAEQFGEFLRRGEDAVETQSRIVDALAASVRRGGFPDWAAANPYVLRHLSAHAAAGRRLGELFEDPRYLIHADPDRLRAALGDVDARLYPMARLYHRVEHRMRALSPADRAEALQEAASGDEPELLEQLSTLLDTVWHGLGSTAEPTPFHRVLRRGHDQPVAVLGFCPGPGAEGPLLVSADSVIVNVWDPATSARLRLLPRLRAAPRHAAVGALADGTPFLAVAEPGGVRVTGLLSGARLHTVTVPGMHSPVLAGGTVAGRPVLAVAAADGVRLLDPEPGSASRSGAVLVETAEPVLDLALASSGERDVLAVAVGQSIVLCDARTGERIRNVAVWPAQWTMALGLDEHGRILLAVGGARGVVEYWHEDREGFTRARADRPLAGLRAGRARRSAAQRRRGRRVPALVPRRGRAPGAPAAGQQGARPGRAAPVGRPHHAGHRQRQLRRAGVAGAAAAARDEQRPGRGRAQRRAGAGRGRGGGQLGGRDAADARHRRRDGPGAHRRRRAAAPVDAAARPGGEPGLRAGPRRGRVPRRGAGLLRPRTGRRAGGAGAGAHRLRPGAGLRSGCGPAGQRRGRGDGEVLAGGPGGGRGVHGRARGRTGPVRARIRRADAAGLGDPAAGGGARARRAARLPRGGGGRGLGRVRRVRARRAGRPGDAGARRRGRDGRAGRPRRRQGGAVLRRAQRAGAQRRARPGGRAGSAGDGGRRSQCPAVGPALGRAAGPVDGTGPATGGRRVPLRSGRADPGAGVGGRGARGVGAPGADGASRRRAGRVISARTGRG